MRTILLRISAGMACLVSQVGFISRHRTANYLHFPMPSKNGFELNERDIELLHYLYQLRIATVDQLAALSGRSVRSLWGRLLKLKERRYVAIAARFMQKNAYAVGPVGASLLAAEGYATADIREKRLRHNELTDFGIRHSLFVADIHARMLLLTRGTPVSLSRWIEGTPLWDTIPAGDGAPAIPIRPDSYFVLTNSEVPEGKKTIHVFLEADRSTMAHTRMAAKVRGYLAYHAGHRYAKKYPGMQSFIVATVTQTRSRAVELRRDLHPLIPRTAQAAYPFIAFEDLTLERLVPELPNAFPGVHPMRNP